MLQCLLQATAKLKAAEEAGSAAERDAAAREALAGLLRVPQCVNLSQMVGRLAFLRQYEVRRRQHGEARPQSIFVLSFLFALRAGNWQPRC